MRLRTMALAGAMIAAGAATPAMADNSVNVTVQCPTSGYTASVADITIEPVQFDPANQTQATGAGILTAADNSCSLAGWSVQVSISDFSAAGGKTIGKENVTSLWVGGSSMDAGTGAQPVDPCVGGEAASCKGPVTYGTTGTTYTPSLASPTTFLRADPGYGAGSYTIGLPVVVNVPARTAAAAYTATLTVTIGPAL